MQGAATPCLLPYVPVFCSTLPTYNTNIHANKSSYTGTSVPPVWYETPSKPQWCCADPYADTFLCGVDLHVRLRWCVGGEQLALSVYHALVQAALHVDKQVGWLR